MSQVVTDDYALYLGDCLSILPQLAPQSVHFSVYSPPFAGLWTYSSNPRDLSNCRSYDEFMAHYAYVVEEIARVTLPGRLSAVHCMDTPLSNSGCDALRDFPGDVIRLHERLGFAYAGRHCIWKEPLAVRNRTMQKNLAHATIVSDSTLAGVASADYLLMFRRAGTNPIPVAHPTGLLDYAGERQIPHELRGYRGYTGNQIENRYSHWIWRQYASAFWDDIRLDRVLPFQDSRDPEDEKHIHPLQLDVIERAIILRTNPGESVLTPFMGVGSEVYGAVSLGRKGIGIELKPSYYTQACKNVPLASRVSQPEALSLFAEETA
ncbi:MAG TPA: DNA methyltransferase [Nitrospiraceae bacterium]